MGKKFYALKESKAMLDDREGFSREYLRLDKWGGFDLVNSTEWLVTLDFDVPNSLFLSLREAKRTRAKFFKRGTVNWPDIVKIEETVVG